MVSEWCAVKVTVAEQFTQTPDQLNLIIEIKQWCEDFCLGRYSYRFVSFKFNGKYVAIFYFRNRRDAMRFKLTFV